VAGAVERGGASSECAGPNSERLLLFDIDGTLLSGATDGHLDALLGALASVHGIETAAIRPPAWRAGRTDGEIARATLLAAGVETERIDERAHEVAEVCCEAYAALCELDLSHCVIDGIPELLGWLSAIGGVRVALVTGNYEGVGRLKLARAGLGGWFAAGQGAFASDSEDRMELAPIARRRAGSPHAPFRRERTLLIGDTPRDIACAKADGLACVAVTTGPFAFDELSRANAVASDPGELRDALEVWLRAA
jgi:phosphoglycolate phosphatase-like HAD superfamily hydrolase